MSCSKTLNIKCSQCYFCLLSKNDLLKQINVSFENIGVESAVIIFDLVDIAILKVVLQM